MTGEALSATIDELWGEAIPTLLDYIRIPAQSPAFDPDWAVAGHLDEAAELLAHWARDQLRAVDHAKVEIVRLPGRTPAVFVEIPGRECAPVLCYGHLDKQPPMDGWVPGRGAWNPTIEQDRLYGRGGADDGYSLFSAIIAICALRRHGLDHPPVRILIEGSEESGSGDLRPTIDHLLARLGEPSLIIALDAGCGNYDQLWTTTSLRGQVAGTLVVRTLREGVHSGDASGIVPSSLRVARLLLSRLEDAETGQILPEYLHADIPAERCREAKLAGESLGSQIHEAFPVPNGSHPVVADPAEQLLNRAWRPQLAVTGMDGLPSVKDAAAVAQPFVALKLSIRLPPTVDPVMAGQRIKDLLEDNPPYGCDVSFNPDMLSAGWSAPPVGAALAEAVQNASLRAFGRPAASFGGGGGIPFLAMLSDMFPRAEFLVTGVLGPESNAHGPNEFLHLPTARKLTCALTDHLQ